MASYVVDGLVLPLAVGGHPVLDFCNTRAGWGGPAPKEYLHTLAHLSRWSAEHGLVDPAALPRLNRAATRDPVSAAAVVARALGFRSALYAVLIGPATRSDWDTLNAQVRAAAATARLVPDAGDGVARWEPGPVTVGLPLAAVAWAAAGWLTSAAASTVRACPGEGCGWVFTDPRGRRRWCSMAWCGNRSKARRHAERRRDPAPDA